MTDCLTICPECGLVCPLDGKYGFAVHVLESHPHSAMATAIRVELNRKALR